MPKSYDTVASGEVSTAQAVEGETLKQAKERVKGYLKAINAKKGETKIKVTYLGERPEDPSAPTTSPRVTYNNLNNEILSCSTGFAEDMWRQYPLLKITSIELSS